MQAIQNDTIIACHRPAPEPAFNPLPGRNTEAKHIKCWVLVSLSLCQVSQCIEGFCICLILTASTCRDMLPPSEHVSTGNMPKLTGWTWLFHRNPTGSLLRFWSLAKIQSVCHQRSRCCHFFGVGSWGTDKDGKLAPQQQRMARSWIFYRPFRGKSLGIHRRSESCKTRTPGFCS